MENTTYIFAPYSSSNRTALLSKLVERTETNFQDKDTNGVYPVSPFPIFEIEGRFFAENPNCGMTYKCIPVPNWFTNNDLELLSKMIQDELGKYYGEGSELRAIKADREELILASILKLETERGL